MFIHIFKNQLKILLRKKGMIFWTLVFPIILATLFNLALSGLTKNEKFNVVKIAVVNNSNFSNDISFSNVLKEISKNNENQVFNIEYVDTEHDAKKLVEDNKIEGYYIVNDKIDIVVKSNGIGSTIMKYVVDNYYQTTYIVESIIQFNPLEFKQELIQGLNKDNNYFIDTSNKNTDYSVVYFYTLIGMMCIYAGFFGMSAVELSEANLSKLAARVSISPIHKLKSLLASISAGFVISFSELLILLSYIICILKISFGGNIGYILLITLVGSLAGLTLGTLIGVSNKKSEGVKVGIFLTITMTFSFLSGMMVVDMKQLIAKNIPILAKINPINMITDALYSLYYYDTLDKYYYNVISLVIFAFIMASLSYLIIRRKKYDSI